MKIKMQTLQELKDGKLIGNRQLKISEELTEFPREIFTLHETLELLDLSNNLIDELPEDMYLLTKLKIVFFSFNKFKEFPSQLSKCSSLTMIGFKSNKINLIPENSFPLKLQWLILTDNEIKHLPISIGNAVLLQKCGLAGNRIEYLPESMKQCENLELLRISANKLSKLPDWLLSLPKLAWLAFSGNPCSDIREIKNNLPLIAWDEFIIEKTLGEGASGIIYQAHWITKNKSVAIKVFKGEVTSDGLPVDELNTCISTGYHNNIIPLKGILKQHPQQKEGIVMELIPPNFKNLGNPPSYSTCTRDTFDYKTQFTLTEGISILIKCADASIHLHSKGILHGDLYAHNILHNPQGDIYLGDFGAASFYNQNNRQSENIERLDVSAFGCLTEDILVRIEIAPKNVLYALQKLKEKCTKREVAERPSFLEIATQLKVIYEDMLMKKNK